MSASISQFIYKGPHSQCLLFTMEPDQYLKPHGAPVDILIIAATGELEIGEELVKNRLHAGEYLFFEKDIQHSVRAITAASFYLVKLAPQEQPTIPNEQSNLPNDQSAIPNKQSNLPNDQSAIPNKQSNLPNEQSTIPNEQSIPPNAQ